MTDFRLRKLCLVLDETHHDGGADIESPRQRAAVLAVVSNPFAGRYEPDLQSAMEALKPLALTMGKRLIEALGGPEGIDAYGKGALVGLNGELEHGALWHAPGGYGMRALLGESKAIVPSVKKVGAAGTTLDLPLAHINAAYVRSHFDTMTVMVPDGPKPDEIVFALCMAKGPRIHSRMGGLEAHQIKGEDGLR
ncbi:amino acid synthesis family protein [Defluviimonas aestuarii]|uniref:amino acid synthesis family protein n=1 Tax=Albidovulum aestuarii TaxID=1130726 RepID=UPI00249ADC04|nr:amino acid synthesis family protein [Defluviimonas aestuarii]MDI3338445.1 amino acid synthesis family protein [Defluviimonas aestuarii]